MALMQVMAFDEDGDHFGASFMDYLLPTPMECPSWELGETVTPSPHHPLGAKGVVVCCVGMALFTIIRRGSRP